MPVDGDLDTAIAAMEARLRELDRERAATVRELAQLRARAQAVSPQVSAAGQVEASSWTAQRKLALFADLFRGREDVFPVRWVKPGDGKSGWAPRCANDWKAGICGKLAQPRVKCGECPNQAFLASTEQELLAHLQGRHVMGVYPLLAGDTCRLLAIDLDKRSWRTDVAAIREACDALSLVPAVERSRSGDGAHVWFFFSEPVRAAQARRLGTMLLTDAMARTPTLSMASYDRLFPSQDTLPKGGFGNLIALPLQQQARHDGNTVFLDEPLEPHEDQWSYLHSLPRITPERLRELLAHRADDDGVLEMPGEARDDESPWRGVRPLAQRLAEVELPGALSATLAQRLYVRNADLPAALLDAMRRLAAFANPEFFELQAMRRPTGRTPRVIACFEQAGRYLALPRGCLKTLEDLLADLGVTLDLCDERSDGKPLKTQFKGELTAPQQDAAAAMLAHDLGVLCAPPGIGKTVIAARLIAARGRSTLVLVHRKPLLEQWIGQLEEFLDIDSEEIGTISGGRAKPIGRVDVAMVQSLSSRKQLDELLSGYGHIVVDECHHIPAVMTERILQSAPARHITGLTATPKRRDGHHPIIAMQCGPVRHTISLDTATSSQPLALRVLRRDTPFDSQTLPTEPHIQEIYAALAADPRRTEMIAADTLELAAQGRNPIVLTERRDHLQRLAERLTESGHTLVVLHGGMRPAERRKAHAQLSDTANRQRVVLATGRYIGEGFDDPQLDALLLAMPIAWKGTVTQYAGRLNRAYPAKHDVLIYDYVDAELPVLRAMFAKRLRAYRSLGYELTQTP